jgi:hypothetical protein
MAKKSEIGGGKGAPPQQSGAPSKAPLHEGPAGSGPQAKSKFNKEARDSGEKEPGKSRGAGG